MLLNVARYDPTHVDGLTPTGKTFSVDLIDSTVSITVAGRTRTLALAKAAWEPGDATVAAIQQAYNLLPLNQR